MEGTSGSTQDLIPGPRFGYRHVQVLLLFLLLTIGIGMRVQLSVAIVAMTDNSTTANPNVPTYNWNNNSVLLSSFFWGYVVFQVFAGELGRRFGTKRFLVAGMTINATACALTPFFAKFVGSTGVIICRVAQGVAQGFFYPSIYNLLGKWVPITERSRLGTIALAGSSFGNIVTLVLVGYICSTSWGWPASFYLYGLFGYIWALLFFFFGANSSAEHRHISEEEKMFIESSLSLNGEERKKNTPWRAILTSPPVWSISIAYLGQDWGYTTLSTEVPTYYSKVLHFDIEDNGLLSAAPYLISFILSFGMATLADFIINNGYLSRTVTRKVFTTFGSIVPAIALISLSYLPEDPKWLSVLMLILPNSADSALCGGNYMTHIDISPNYAGVIMGLCNFVPNFCSILAPLLVHAVVKDETDKSQWRIVFITSAMFFLISDFFYVIFASGEVQWWNDGNRNNEEVEARNEDEKEKIY